MYRSRVSQSLSLKMGRRSWLAALAVVLGALGQAACMAEMPNVVYILADDMGIGDVRSYYASSPVNTPNIDSIANAGMRFDHASSSSSVCTPTRYGVLTGRYAWRGPISAGVVQPFGPAILEPATTTVAEMLKSSGYATAAVGKWHLGLNWQTTGGPQNSTGTNVNYSLPFSGGPLDHGFDSYYGDDVINYPPYTMIRDNQTIGIPVGQNGGTTPYIPPGGSNPGYVTPGYSTTQTLPLIVDEADSYIGSRASQPQPFFLYMALTAPHEPIVPPPQFQGSTGTNNYGDFIAAVDWAVGRVKSALSDPNHDGQLNDSVLDNTLIVFAADNGAEDGYSFSTSTGFINGVHLRSDKASVYEGGFRVPLAAQWNGHIQPGAVNSSMVQTQDLMATLADIIGYQLPANVAQDSFSLAPILLGNTTSVRKAEIENSYIGAKVIRQIDSNGIEWKMIFSSNDGGFTGTAINPNTPITNFGLYQLFNLTTDVGESTNLLAGGGTQAMQLKALDLQSLLLQLMNGGRTAPIKATGDFNGDHFVDLDDYGIWRSTFGSNSILGADANNNGIVDASDFTIWRKYFLGSIPGAGAGGGFNVSVPEPSSAILGGFVAAFVYGSWGRRRLRRTLSLASRTP